MTRNELRLKLGIELRIYRDAALFLGIDDVERDGGIALLFALFEQAFGREDFGVRVGFVPVAEEDVVLNVEGGNVLDFAEVFDCGFDVVC